MMILIASMSKKRSSSKSRDTTEFFRLKMISINRFTPRRMNSEEGEPLKSSLSSSKIKTTEKVDQYLFFS